MIRLLDATMDFQIVCETRCPFRETNDIAFGDAFGSVVIFHLRKSIPFHLFLGLTYEQLLDNIPEIPEVLIPPSFSDHSRTWFEGSVLTKRRNIYPRESDRFGNPIDGTAAYQLIHWESCCWLFRQRSIKRTPSKPSTTVGCNNRERSLIVCPESIQRIAWKASR